MTEPEFADIEAAAGRLAGHAVPTPLLESPALNAIAGGRLLIKAEPLQHTGSFKFRGAWNRISRLDASARAAGVVAYSSGNHAQAVAAAAGRLGLEATIVMPSDAPAVKMEGTRSHGAKVVLYDRRSEDRVAIAGAIAEASGATIVPPYDDPLIVAGQGTVGLEIAAQANAMGARPDAALVPCSGGGLVAGCAISLTTMFQGVEIYSVEPAGFDDTARSLASGRHETNPPGVETFCDALRVQTPGNLTFAVNRRLLAGGLAVSDAETATAMAAAFRHLKLVIEPGGAVALAAALTGRLDCRDKVVAVVCSGGNVDAAAFAASISPCSPHPC